MKNGLINENGELIYYENDVPVHAGVIEIDGDIYYISSKGKAVKGQHIVHGEMTHGIIKRGTYTFGEDGKLIKGSYKAPKKDKKSKSKKRKSGKKIFKLKNKDLKKWKPLIFGIVILLVAVIAFVIGMEFKDRLDDNSQNVSNNNDEEIVLPEFNKEVLLCTEGAKMLYDGEIDLTEALKYGSPYRPFVFEYDLKGKSGVLTISENENLSNGKDYVLEVSTTSVSIHNLKTDTKYYYKVTVEGIDYSGSFKTAKSIRFVNIDGIYNTRDIGGYTTLDGKVVKQGLLIRGTELDGLIVPKYFLKNDNVEQALDTFGFVYDLDLRHQSVFAGDIYKSRFGSTVNHKFYGSPTYGEIFNTMNVSAIKNIFSDLAKQENYPMYLHCTYGADRTGTIVFLLQCVLNVSEKDMVSEYRNTAFFEDQYVDMAGIEIVIEGLQNYNGETIQEKAVDYLVNTVGVTQEEIDSIRTIFLE